MDEYSRLIPASNRFPSAANGQGFKPLADYIHGLGLKFGIHIMRGIPRQAVHENLSIWGTDIRAREIAHPNSICAWNTDMYGVDPARAGAQQWYNSIFELYASWGVDYVKVDDISFPYFEGEIELIYNAIKSCDRDMVLSLSCGPAPLDKAEHFKKHANLWRITADYWDRWEDLLDDFEKCNQWSGHVGQGHWPDADMLPLGHLAIRSCEHGVGDRWTRFSKDEQLTMMSLWCIFRSPLMVGGELRDNDDWTLSLLTNTEVLRILTHSHSGRQIYRGGHYDSHVIWTAQDEDGSHYVAMFNTWMAESKMEVQLSKLELKGNYVMRDLWLQVDMGETNKSVTASVPSHGVKLFKLMPKQ